MIDYSISWVPVLGVMLINFFGSWVYYSPVSPLFKKWQLALGMDPNKKDMTEEDKKNMPRLFGGAILASFLISYGMSVFVHSLQLETAIDGAIFGVVAWAVFAVTLSLNTQFEGRKPVVLVINNILYLVTYAGFGAIFAVWK
jgi:UDP-N-acetylmuramyl pentapeptide phosphotransferase/UDP-N-acetylglucosamine-1-phosphate transferase